MNSAPLSKVAPPKSSDRRLSPETVVWHLGLDQIASGSGAIENRIFAPAKEAGSSTFIFDERNVLYSKLRPYLNKVICPDSIGVATSELVPLRPDPKKLDRQYHCYYLRSPSFVSWISSKVAGAKMPRAKMDAFWQHEIPLPSLDEQKRIAYLLSKVEGLIAQRKRHLQQLDDLLKSIFLDMFGDIRAKLSQHNWEPSRPYVKASSGKSSKSVKSDTETAVPIYGGNGVNGWATKALFTECVVVAGRVGWMSGVWQIQPSRSTCRSLTVALISKR